ncbi:hypothetical protein BIW11_02395 [Tropilaelaps mercedesae]|uniref:Uncharacterized protein n=1 Tax=Tropilaelaps mercedesae TaxID=418985 RepID=A0A1V9WY22_9ACAR|nr:hypothetical protein BIW11_02395 [Tropilaelaps mercedesae]
MSLQLKHEFTRSPKTITSLREVPGREGGPAALPVYIGRSSVKIDQRSSSWRNCTALTVAGRSVGNQTRSVRCPSRPRHALMPSTGLHCLTDIAWLIEDCHPNALADVVRYAHLPSNTTNIVEVFL